MKIASPLAGHRNRYLLRSRAVEFVYFIQAGDGAVKIGRARNPRSRLRQLQTANAETLVLLGCIAGGLAVEAALHAKFRAHHIGGEWFKPAPELMEWIARALEKLLEGYTDVSEVVALRPINLRMPRWVAAVDFHSATIAMASKDAREVHAFCSENDGKSWEDIWPQLLGRSTPLFILQ